jgi:hypothetical protein
MPRVTRSTTILASVEQPQLGLLTVNIVPPPTAPIVEETTQQQPLEAPTTQQQRKRKYNSSSKRPPSTTSSAARQRADRRAQRKAASGKSDQSGSGSSGEDAGEEDPEQTERSGATRRRVSKRHKADEASTTSRPGARRLKATNGPSRRTAANRSATEESEQESEEEEVDGDDNEAAEAAEQSEAEADEIEKPDQSMLEIDHETPSLLSVPSAVFSSQLHHSIHLPVSTPVAAASVAPDALDVSPRSHELLCEESIDENEDLSSHAVSRATARRLQPRPALFASTPQESSLLSPPKPLPAFASTRQRPSSRYIPTPKESSLLSPPGQPQAFVTMTPPMAEDGHSLLSDSSVRDAAAQQHVCSATCEHTTAARSTTATTVRRAVRQASPSIASITSHQRSHKPLPQQKRSSNIPAAAAAAASSSSRLGPVSEASSSVTNAPRKRPQAAAATPGAGLRKAMRSAASASQSSSDVRAMVDFACAEAGVLDLDSPREEEEDAEEEDYENPKVHGTRARAAMSSHLHPGSNDDSDASSDDFHLSQDSAAIREGNTGVYDWYSDEEDDKRRRRERGEAVDSTDGEDEDAEAEDGGGKYEESCIPSSAGMDEDDPMVDDAEEDDEDDDDDESWGEESSSSSEQEEEEEAEEEEAEDASAGDDHAASSVSKASTRASKRKASSSDTKDAASVAAAAEDHMDVSDLNSQVSYVVHSAAIDPLTAAAHVTSARPRPHGFGFGSRVGGGKRTSVAAQSEVSAEENSHRSGKSKKSHVSLKSHRSARSGSKRSEKSGKSGKSSRTGHKRTSLAKSDSTGDSAPTASHPPAPPAAPHKPLKKPPSNSLLRSPFPRSPLPVVMSHSPMHDWRMEAYPSHEEAIREMMSPKAAAGRGAAASSALPPSSDPYSLLSPALPLSSLFTLASSSSTVPPAIPYNFSSVHSASRGWSFTRWSKTTALQERRRRDQEKETKRQEEQAKVRQIVQDEMHRRGLGEMKDLEKERHRSLSDIVIGGPEESQKTDEMNDAADADEEERPPEMASAEQEADGDIKMSDTPSAPSRRPSRTPTLRASSSSLLSSRRTLASSPAPSSPPPPSLPPRRWEKTFEDLLDERLYEAALPQMVLAATSSGSAEVAKALTSNQPSSAQSSQREWSSFVPPQLQAVQAVYERHGMQRGSVPLHALDLATPAAVTMRALKYHRSESQDVRPLAEELLRRQNSLRRIDEATIRLRSKDGSEVPTLLTLSSSSLTHILSFLPLHDLLSSRCTAKRMHQVITRTKVVWARQIILLSNMTQATGWERRSPFWLTQDNPIHTSTLDDMASVDDDPEEYFLPSNLRPKEDLLPTEYHRDPLWKRVHAGALTLQSKPFEPLTPVGGAATSSSTGGPVIPFIYHLRLEDDIRWCATFWNRLHAHSSTLHTLAIYNNRHLGNDFLLGLMLRGLQCKSEEEVREEVKTKPFRSYWRMPFEKEETAVVAAGDSSAAASTATSATTTKVTAAFPNLTDLTIFACPMVDLDTGLLFLPYYAHTLKALNLTKSSAIGGGQLKWADERHLAELPNPLGSALQLERLELAGCRELLPIHIWLLRPLSHLSVLDLSWCLGVNDRCLINLCRAPSMGRAMKRLSLAGCTGLTDETLLVAVPHLTSLEFLDVSHVSSLTNRGFAGLLELKHLERIIMRFLPLVSDTLCTILCRLESLNYLDVNFCPRITVHGKIAMKNHKKGLPLYFLTV